MIFPDTTDPTTRILVMHYELPRERFNSLGSIRKRFLCKVGFAWELEFRFVAIERSRQRKGRRTTSSWRRRQGVIRRRCKWRCWRGRRWRRNWRRGGRDERRKRACAVGWAEAHSTNTWRSRRNVNYDIFIVWLSWRREDKMHGYTFSQFLGQPSHLITSNPGICRDIEGRNTGRRIGISKTGEGFSLFIGCFRAWRWSWNSFQVWFHSRSTTIFASDRRGQCQFENRWSPSWKFREDASPCSFRVDGASTRVGAKRCTTGSCARMRRVRGWVWAVDSGLGRIRFVVWTVRVGLDARPRFCRPESELVLGRGGRELNLDRR